MRALVCGANMSLTARAISNMVKVDIAGSFLSTIIVITLPIEPKNDMIMRIMPHNMYPCWPLIILSNSVGSNGLEWYAFWGKSPRNKELNCFKLKNKIELLGLRLTVL